MEERSLDPLYVRGDYYEQRHFEDDKNEASEELGKPDKEMGQEKKNP